MFLISMRCMVTGARLTILLVPLLIDPNELTARMLEFIIGFDPLSQSGQLGTREFGEGTKV